MDIVIIADFCGRFNQKDNGRFTYLAQLLCERHSVEIITSDFKHGEKNILSLHQVIFLIKSQCYMKDIIKKMFAFKDFEHTIYGGKM